MKSLLPLRTMLFLASLVSFSFIGNAQAIDGGSVAISTPCYSLSLPAPVVNSLSAATGGTAPYSYQWQAKINPSQWVDVIVGGTSETLSPGTLFNPTSYRRKATDAAGLVGYSNTVDFTVSDALKGGSVRLLGGYNTILVNTAPDVIASFSTAYDGSGSYTYLWETATDEAGPWTSIGITTLDYQSPVINSLGTVYFRRKATDISCGFAAYSNVIKIVTVASLPFIANGYTYQYNCVFPGYLPSLLRGASPYGGTAPYSYQWESKVGNNAWTIINGATSMTYQPPVLTESVSFRRKATDAAGAFGYSNEDMVAYAPLTPLPGSIASNATQLIAPNAPANSILNITSASNAYNGNYFWQSSSDNGATWNSIPGYNHSTYYVDFSPTVRTCYRRGITSTCATNDIIAVTDYVCLDPTQPLTAGTISSNNLGGCIQIGTSLGTITGTPATGGNIPYIYLWQKKQNGVWIDIPGTNTVSYSAGTILDDISYRRKVTDASNASLLSNEITITVSGNVNLKGGIVDGPIITCSGTAPGIINNIIDACGGGGPLTYVWEASTGGGAWAPITNTNAPTHNATAISADTKFRRRVGDGCGNAGYSNEVEVFVYPAIEAGTIFPATQTVCSNQAAAILSLMQNCHYTNGQVSYQWQKSTSRSGPWTGMTGAAGTYSFYQPGSVATTYYRLKVSSTVCGAVAYSNIATVNVNTNCSGKAALSTGSLALDPSTLSTRGSLKVYPNPATQGQLVTVAIDGIEGNCKALLRSTDGRAFNCTVTSASKGQLQVKLPSLMAKGTYLIQVSNNKQQWIERIVVQ
jgi:hypothetical protein